MLPKSPHLLTKKEMSELFQKIDSKRTSKQSSENKDAAADKITEESTQELIHVENVIDGIIFMTDGSIVKIMEVLPLNFSEKTALTKDQIANTFGYGLKQCPRTGHIKIMHSETDLYPFKKCVTDIMASETDASLISRANDYIANTERLQSKNTTKNRFFFIFEYEGDDGKQSASFEDIRLSMYQTAYSVRHSLESCGNTVIDYTGQNLLSLVEILYMYFNPKSKYSDTYNDRIKKVRAACDYLRSATGDNSLSAPFPDFIASRGIKFLPWDTMLMDGIYHTYLALKDESFPTQSYAGTLTNDLMTGLPDCDLDIYYKEQPRETALYVLDRVNVIKEGLSFGTSAHKQEELLTGSANAKYLKDCMTEHDEELYNVSIFLTLRADSQKALRIQKNAYIKNMKTRSYYFEQCFLKTQEFFKMTMPFMYINNKLFNDTCRNMTNDGFGTLYCFTSFDMFDPEGPCMGIAVKNKTLFSLNNFDTRRFPNPHIHLCGTSGSGKSFTEMMLTGRMRMHGVRTMFILPLKGHEYRDHVRSMGGEFISLRPGAKSCINIMEIRPEGTANSNSIDEDLIEEMEKGPSLLSKKITQIITWLRLLVGDDRDRLTIEEVSELNVILKEIYQEYGITDNNDSIYLDKEKGILKTMPIIEDILHAIEKNDVCKKRVSVLKPWVYGNCSNMNGQTNVNVNTMMVAFDINEDYIGEDLLPAFMFIAFDICYDMAKRDEYEKCAIALDEIWKMLAIEECAKQIFKMIKILRAYGSCAITATQDIEDCYNNQYGRAILSNSAIKIYLRLEPEEMAVVEKCVSFSEQNKEEIISAPKGTGFVCFGSERIKVKFEASPLEVELYTTDINVKRQLRSQREGLKTQLSK